jgi:hypothetical protein
MPATPDHDELNDKIVHPKAKIVNPQAHMEWL